MTIKNSAIATFLAVLMPGLAQADIWTDTPKDMSQLLKEGYEIVGFDVDSSGDRLVPKKFRYILQLKTEDGNKAALCSESDRGTFHQCWITKG